MRINLRGAATCRMGKRIEKSKKQYQKHSPALTKYDKSELPVSIKNTGKFKYSHFPGHVWDEKKKEKINVF